MSFGHRRAHEMSEWYSGESGDRVGIRNWPDGPRVPQREVLSPSPRRSGGWSSIRAQSLPRLHLEIGPTSVARTSRRLPRR
jgi:hypothetical protein